MESERLEDKVHAIKNPLNTETHLENSSSRYCLNYKGLPYKTVWLEYPDIEPTMKKIGALPTGKRPDGSILYTIPAIYDDSTGTAIAESTLIAEYLDKTYPSTPRIIPPGTHALQLAFADLFFSKNGPLMLLLLPDVPFNPISVEFFNKHHAPIFGAPTLEGLRVSPEQQNIQWEKVKDIFGKFDEMIKEDGIWVMGNTPSFADFVIGSLLITVKAIYGKESGEWKRIMSWHGGRWKRLMRGLDGYSAVL